MDQKVFQKVHPQEYLKRFLVNGVRPDGRSPTTTRRISVKVGSISTAVGSAMLQIGRTTAVAGVHASLIAPAVGAPDQGMLNVSVELLSLASLSNKSGRVSDEATCLTEYVRSLLSPHVNLSKLCVEAGKVVWRLRLHIYCVDNDGNLEDSVLLAAVAAMRNVMLPTVRMVEDSETQANGMDTSDMKAEKEVQYGGSVLAVATAERTNSLEMESFPLPVSFILFEGNALIDPSAEEEHVSDSRLTFLFRPSGELRGILKPGGTNLSEKMYKSCLAQAKERIPILLDKLTET